MTDDWQVVEEALNAHDTDLWGNPSKLQPLALAALARLREREAQLEREGDEWKATAAQESDWLAQSEARVAALEEALREIASDEQADLVVTLPQAIAIARRALAHEEEK